MKRATLAFALALGACNSGSAPAPTAPAPTVETPQATKGQVVTRTFHSEALGVDKDYVVYLPAGYEASPAKRYPVLYYLHGIGGDEHSWVKGGHLDEAADRLALQAIVVMPDGDECFYTDAVEDVDYDACLRDHTGLFFPTAKPHHDCVRHRKYETYMVSDLVHDVDAHYRTIAARGARAVAGLSMGGYGALALSLRHPEVFAAAASHSGLVSLSYDGPHPYVAGKAQLLTDFHTWGRAADAILPHVSDWMRGIFGTDAAVWKAHDPTSLVASLAPGTLALYIDCGTEDEFLFEDSASYLHELLLARKIDHAFYLGPGHHDFKFWIPRVSESLKFLRDHVEH